MAVGIGLEVGGSVLRAAVVERRGSSRTLLAWREVPCDTSSTESLTQGLGHLRRTLRLKGGVVLGVPTSSALLATVEPLLVNARRASLAIQFELQQYLPFDLEQAAWHYQWLNGHASTPPRRRARPISRGGQSLESPGPARKALVVAMKRSRLEERLACCRRAGLSIRAVAINPLAALNACSPTTFQGTPQQGPLVEGEALFLHLSEQQAEWVVWSPSHVQVVPIAMSAGSSSPDQFQQALGQSLESLRGLMGASLGSGTPVWIFGANAQWPQVADGLRSALLQVERLDLGRTVGLEAAKVESAEGLIVAVGLALQGLGAGPLHVNLLTAGQSLVSAQRIRHIAFGASGICTAMALGFGISGMTDVRQRYARVLTDLNQRERTYQTLRPEVRTLLKRQAHVEGRTAQLRVLVADRALLGDSMVQVSEAMPDDVWLTKLDMAHDEAGEAIEGMVEGRAKSFQSVTRFIEQLKRVGGMTTVKPLATNVATDESTGREVVVFSIVVKRPVRLVDDPT